MRRLVLIFLFSFCYFFAFSQIVNIENQRLKKTREGFSGNFDLSFSLTSNTRTIYQFGTRNKINWKKDRHNVLGIADFNMVVVDKTNLVNYGFHHGRYSYNTEKFKRVFLEGFEQLQYNRIQLIDLRLLLGGGSRVAVVDKDSIALNLGAFIMGEYERQTDDIINTQIRYSCFVSFDYQFNKTTGINTITYFQPDILYLKDARISSETSLRFGINKNIKFKLVYTLNYDPFPPKGAPKTIYYLQNVFSYEF